MRRLEDERTDVDIRVELFLHLTPQGVGVALCWTDLPAGKLPHPGEMDALRTASDEKRVVLFDDGSDDDDGGHFRLWALGSRC